MKLLNKAIVVLYRKGLSIASTAGESCLSKAGEEQNLSLLCVAEGQFQSLEPL